MYPPLYNKPLFPWPGFRAFSCSLAAHIRFPKWFPRLIFRPFPCWCIFSGETAFFVSVQTGRLFRSVRWQFLDENWDRKSFYLVLPFSRANPIQRFARKLSFPLSSHVSSKTFFFTRFWKGDEESPLLTSTIAVYFLSCSAKGCFLPSEFSCFFSFPWRLFCDFDLPEDAFAPV